MGLNKPALNRPLKLIPVLLLTLLSLSLAFITEVYMTLAKGVVEYTGGYLNLAKNIIQSMSLKRTAVLICAFLLLCFSLYLFGRQIGGFIYRFRWPLGIGVIVFAVIFEISGSSVGIWSAFMNDPAVTDSGVLLGQSRTIRSDEWAVHTPMTFSQYYGGFPVFGEIFRGSTTDMYMVYGQPVMDWTVIFRPFQIGYLFLSPARGMSFYWVGKLVFLILVSFEMGMLISNKNKLLSLVYSVMIAFAPVVQWWFGANSFPEMLIYGQSIVLCVSAYMRTKKYLLRALCCIGFIITGGAYILVMYPAWQIPFFYVFLALGIWVIVSHRKSFELCAKKDIPLIAGSVVLLGACMLFVIFRSKDTIAAVMGSAYPGDRLEMGGAGFSCLLRYPGNLFTPLCDAELPGNQSEMSSFFGLFPLGAILSLLVLFRDKIKDKLLIFMWVVQIFLGTYIILGFPELLSKLTLLSNSQVFRAVIAFLFADVIIFIRSLAVRRSGLKLRTALPVAAVLAVAVTYYSKRLAYGSYFVYPFMLISIAVLGVLFFLALYKSKRTQVVFCAVMCGVMLVVGGLVNPVQRGTEAIDGNRLSKAVQQIQKDDGGIWISESCQWMEGNFLAMNGAPALNSTSTYCNRDMWDKLDPAGQYDEIYNRYAHIYITLKNDAPTKPQLIQPDLIQLDLNISDLDDIGVDYILTSRDLTELNSDECTFAPVFEQDGINRMIYRVNYTK